MLKRVVAIAFYGGFGCVLFAAMWELGNIAMSFPLTWTMKLAIGGLALGVIGFLLDLILLHRK